MKKAIVVFVFLLCANLAHADYRLLPTDVLEAKQVEAAVLFAYKQGTGNFDYGSGAGSQSWDTFFSACSFGVGLGSGFQINASIPYVFTDKSRTYYDYNTSYIFRNSDGSGGFEDFSLSGKYLILDEKNNPFAMAAGLGVKFNTTKATGPFSGGDSTDFKPLLTASKKVGPNFTPFISYSAYIRSNSDYQNSHCLLIGSEFKIHQNASLVPEFGVRFYGESEKWSSNREYFLSLSSSIQAFRNFYLIPSVSFSTATDYRYKLTPQTHYDRQRTAGGGLSFNYLW